MLSEAALVVPIRKCLSHLLLEGMVLTAKVLKPNNKLWNSLMSSLVSHIELTHEFSFWDLHMKQPDKFTG